MCGRLLTCIHCQPRCSRLGVTIFSAGNLSFGRSFYDLCSLWDAKPYLIGLLSSESLGCFLVSCLQWLISYHILVHSKIRANFPTVYHYVSLNQSHSREDLRTIAVNLQIDINTMKKLNFIDRVCLTQFTWQTYFWIYAEWICFNFGSSLSSNIASSTLIPSSPSLPFWL